MAQIKKRRENTVINKHVYQSRDPHSGESRE